LDQASVAWLTSFLQNAHDITCLIVTHDTQFMDDVVTDIIHYESRKLVYYHGNLSHFVKIHPDAKYYYELSTSTMRFKFPVPERLDGINSNTRSIMKLENVNFTYPGKTVPQLTNINVRVCLGSRIAVLGANGAGKVRHTSCILFLD
jgi:elongation factor 3